MKPPFIDSAPGTEPVVASGEFPAAPERVFRAWTDLEELRRWFAAAAPDDAELSADVREGGTWRLRYGAGEGGFEEIRGRYTIVNPPHALAFTWEHHVARPDGKSETTAESLVTIKLAPVDGAGGKATRLRLVHSRIKSVGGRRGVGEGWSTTLERLRGLLS